MRTARLRRSRNGDMNGGGDSHTVLYANYTALDGITYRTENVYTSLTGQFRIGKEYTALDGTQTVIFTEA